MIEAVVIDTKDGYHKLSSETLKRLAEKQFPDEKE
jgi:hypothetical protein